jgi:hypothetical protein
VDMMAMLTSRAFGVPIRARRLTEALSKTLY